MKIDLIQIAQRAWEITWKHKILWVFGFLFSLGLGGGGNSNFNFDANTFSTPGGNLPLPPELNRTLEDLSANTGALIGIGLLLVCLGLLISLAVYALSVMGRGGLIVGTRLAEANGAVTFGEAWRGAARRFWALIGVNLLINAPVIVLSLVLAFSVLGGTLGLVLSMIGGEVTAITGVLGVLLLCITPLVCVVPLLSLFTNFFSTLASLNVVIEDLGMMPAIRRAWAVLTQNPVDVVVVGVVLALAQGIIGFLISLPLTVIVVGGVVAAFPTLWATGSMESILGPVAFAALCLVLYMPVFLVLLSAALTWVNAAWTLAYEKLLIASGGTPANPNAVTL